MVYLIDNVKNEVQKANSLPQLLDMAITAKSQETLRILFQKSIEAMAKTTLDKIK